tara:strand:- start:4584 stop:5027 length:444 start_codon:yes stop_codon:yes gene_type:complete
MIKEKVTLHPLKIIKSDLGNIRHIFDSNKAGFNGFSEAYISEINPLKIKGWVLHKNKTSNFIVVKGHVRFVFIESNNPERFITYELSSLDEKPHLYSRLCVEPNVWFAFQGLHCKVSRVLNLSNVFHSETLSIRKTLSTFKYCWDKS